MFQFLKDKLKNWTKNLVKDSEEKEEKEVKPVKEKKPEKVKEDKILQKAEEIVEEVVKEFQPEKDIAPELKSTEEKEGFFKKIVGKVTKVKIT